jgi:histidine triad (HIT) family protein
MFCGLQQLDLLLLPPYCWAIFRSTLELDKQGVSLDCIFCKITSGEIPATFVAESEHAVAFNDINPTQPVHVLVVPRVHYTDVAHLAVSDTEVLADLIQLGVKVAELTSTGSFRLQFNTGAEAGQTVFHAHGHITSRTPRS